MISQPKGTAGSPTNAAEFYDFTRRLLVDARSRRDGALLRRAAIRIDSERFAALSDSRRDELSDLYAEAAAACGVGSIA